MRTKRTIGLLLTIMLLILSITACRPYDTEPTKTTVAAEISDLYRFEDCESSEVFNIKRVELSEDLAARCTSYSFTYMSDGLKINAYISIPNTLMQTQKPGKCLMYNHGGNRDYGKLEKETTANACVICRRIVVASQYRGCGGSEGTDRFGGDDLRDVIKLIDLCEKQFTFIDMDDFCVLGASRGGVMTYPAARQDSRIKRIIGMSAVTDLFDSYESRDDKMKSVLIETVGCTPQENPEEYKKRSAVYWADEITVPVLLIHSKGDQLVSYRQAEELYTKLKDHTECRFISHDDDKHSIPHQEDITAIREWLE